MFAEGPKVRAGAGWLVLQVLFYDNSGFMAQCARCGIDSKSAGHQRRSTNEEPIQIEPANQSRRDNRDHSGNLFHPLLLFEIDALVLVPRDGGADLLRGLAQL